MKEENKKEDIEKLNESLDSIRIDTLSPGEKTRRILEKKGIKSPPIKGMVLVSTKPNTWIVKKTKK